LYNNNNSRHDNFVEADKGRLIQVISNLLSNAIKFSTVGTTILVKAEQKEQGKDNRHVVFVSVKDTGKGIDPDILPKLFTKFATKSDKGYWNRPRIIYLQKYRASSWW
jgi:signal transduction histidine kinase